MVEVLVTGGGGGIGAAVCLELASDHQVVVAGRDLGRLEATAAAVRTAGGTARVASFDLADAGATQAALAEHGPVGTLVLCAGIALSAPVGGEDAEDLHRRHFEVNYHGARRLLEAALPAWKETGGGRAVMVASSAALRGYAYVSAYAASKHALLGYCRSAALELRRYRVAVNVVCPHYVDSPMTDASAERIAETTGRGLEEARAWLAAQNPGGRLVTPAEVARAVRELVSTPRTGVVLELPGGEAIEVEPGLPLE
jgi:3-hydroxybutyrate dehydrogenase